MHHTVNFKAKAHLLKLLGDQLIGNDRLAIFELVKNAYDANATNVEVYLGLDNLPAIIRVSDNGAGMSIDTLKTKWMELGTDSKRGVNRYRSPEPFKRLPLGEKGIGRLAVHKLGNKLKLITKAENSPECLISIDWPKLITNSEYIEDAGVEIVENQEPMFLTESTGTIIEISGLHKVDWKRGEIRDLHKLITSIISPFSTVSDFKVNLNIPEYNDWLQDLPDVHEILDHSLWKFEFKIDEDAKFSWDYHFKPPIGFRSIKSKSLSNSNDILELIKNNTENLVLKSSQLQGIGPIQGNCYFYLLSKKALSADGNYLFKKKYLSEQTGVRVYRDGIRVFNYGEPNDDWLNLNTARINNPSKRLGTNSVVAAINLDLEKSMDSKSQVALAEKTNREGFDENEAYMRLKLIISSVFDKFFRLHSDDRIKIENHIKGVRESHKPDPSTTFDNAIADISKSIEKHGLKKEIGKKVNFIANEYKRMRDFSLNAGLKGLNLAVIFHEVEREIDYLNKDIKSEQTFDRLKDRVQHLVKLIEGFRPLLRRNEQKTFKISVLIKNTIDPMKSRFQFHGISISSPVLTNEDTDFTITAPYGLLMASLQNLINNSMYWSRLRFERDNSKTQPGVAIFTLSDWFEEGPAIVVADNGTGFSIPPEQAVEAFISDRAGGAGLGLYFVNLVMENIGGKLLIMEPDELDLPKAFSGSAVVMIFKGIRENV